MDLLCTENIIHEYETETLCHHHHQQSLTKEQKQQEPKHRSAASSSVNSNTSPPSVYSSSSSLSSSSCSSTTSSGYNSSSSSSNSSTGNYHSAKLACEETSHSFRETTSSRGSPPPPTQQQQQQQHHQKLSSTSDEYCGNSSAGQNVYANNLITRSMDYVNTATEDPTFLSDRCLENALKAEEKRPPPVCTYFMTVQEDITPPMRKIVAEWMMEVCAEEKCQEEVVLLALNYMDRFLSTKSVRKTHLQILAAACLLLASKLREPSCRALSAELLVFYTDNSIHKADLIKWELYVLSRLGWDLSCVTPLDFLELLLIRLPIRSNEYPDLDVDKVRQHAQAFISLAAKEHHFSMYSASTIAASSIAAALSGLNWHLRTGRNLRYLFNLLTDLTSVEQDNLHNCMMNMETIFEEHSRNLEPYLGSAEHAQHQKGAGSLNVSHINPAATSICTTAPSPLPTQSQYLQQPNYHHYSVYHHGKQQFNPHHQQHQHHHQPLRHMSQHHHSTVSAASSASCSSSHDVVTGSVTANVLLPNLTQTCKMQANAQKEVQDIKF